MCAIMCACHHIVVEGASSETIQRTLGRSFSVSIVLSIIASSIAVTALGAVIDIEPVPPPSSIALMLLAPVSGCPSPLQRYTAKNSPVKR
jgi:hypothetical protein